jgi:hypothetical protein
MVLGGDAEEVSCKIEAAADDDSGRDAHGSGADLSEALLGKQVHHRGEIGGYMGRHEGKKKTGAERFQRKDRTLGNTACFREYEKSPSSHVKMVMMPARSSFICGSSQVTRSS